LSESLSSASSAARRTIDLLYMNIKSKESRSASLFYVETMLKRYRACKDSWTVVLGQKMQMLATGSMLLKFLDLLTKLEKGDSWKLGQLPCLC